MFKLSEEDYLKVKRYVVSTGEAVNGDRCITMGFSLDSELYDIHMCFNDNLNLVKICKIVALNGSEDGILEEGEVITNHDFKLKCFEQLVYSAKNDKYIENVSYYDFYTNVIENETEDCECFNLKSV